MYFTSISHKVCVKKLYVPVVVFFKFIKEVPLS